MKRLSFLLLLAGLAFAQVTTQRADLDRLRYHDTVPKKIPSSGETVFSSDVYVIEITLTNTHSADVTVTIADRQSTPVAVVDTLTIASKAHYILRYEGRYCPSGVTWIASVDDVVAAYMRVKK